MFQAVKREVDLVSLISEDTGLPFKLSGENYVIEDDNSTEGCPFCGHHDCFRIKPGEDSSEGFWKCFSCDRSGDAIGWVQQRQGLATPVEACRALAKRFNITLPASQSPIQELFTLAADYYQAALHENCLKPYVELGGVTPIEYQLNTRKHSVDILKRMAVGWSDGGLIEYLLGLGYDPELIESSGLQGRKVGRDFLPAKCFIYPHKVNGKVSHFTFKDPTKRLAYQLPKKYSLNGVMFYNQDSVSKSSTVAIVEGENDAISMLATGQSDATIATIGQLSGEQLEWMRVNLAGKSVITLFDPDEAGAKYRQKVHKVRAAFNKLAHVLPPDGKDIDEVLRDGADVLQVIRDNLTQVSDAPSIAHSDTEGRGVGSVLSAEAFQSLVSNTLGATPSGAATDNPTEDSLTEPEDGIQSGSILQKGGVYYRVSYKEGEQVTTQISDFVLQLKNIYLTEDGDRQREVVVIRDNGFTSDPVLIDSETKVNEKPFKVLIAKVSDGTFRGTGKDLADIWLLVNSQVPDVLVRVPKIVGRLDKHKGFLFRNVFVSDTGVVTTPDDAGIFWMHGRSIGIKPQSLDQGNAMNSVGADVPRICTDLSAEEADTVMAGFIKNLSRNLTGDGLALTALGWAKMCLYSDLVFRLNKGVPQLFFWGTNGKGKTTIAKWIQDLYSMRDVGSTSVPNLRSGVGWARKGEFYSGLPLMIDEVRSNEETRQYLGTFRGYYDREGRTMGTQDGFGVRTTTVRSCFIFVGEDQFEDPATRERCVPIRIPANGRETVETYRWIEDHRHLFSGILYHWMLEYGRTDPAELQREMRALDKELVDAGCPQRTSKNWAAVGVFGMQLGRKYLPEFDFKSYIIEACSQEASTQREGTTLMQFWEHVENLCAKEDSPITDNHVMVEDVDGKRQLHLHYAYIYKAVLDANRGNLPFSKNAVLGAIREEPYFLCDKSRKAMGMKGDNRPRVLTLDLDKCPDVLRNVAKAL